MKNIFNVLIFFLFFSESGCQLQKPEKENEKTVSIDSVFTDNPSGILLSKSYTNDKDGYSINYPPNWNFYEYENAGGIDFFGHFKTPAENDDMSDFGIAIYNKNESKTLDEFYEDYIAEAKASGLLSDISVKRNMAFIYQGKYNTLSFLFTSKSVGTFDTRIHMFIEKGDKIYHLRGLLSPKHPKESMQLYLEIMTTIKFSK
ncbi:hypothetical protein C9994_02005 [Marivirga lumbricoides]|uniref:PsbP C-terminal domain-containing protein n=1 Tax=Marivirga lumbricoides TaxID=1046115 RepID=A0A2T4DUZ4_9BACT|nr:hypothetical protein C9994_02005 [Marivirga lumbricoides]